MLETLLEEYEAYQIINVLGLIIGLTFGVIAQKAQFCFSGSIKDYLQTGSTRRGASVIMAMIVAIISTTLLTSHYELDVTESYYFRDNINYFAIIIGGALFGAGMMIADGCSSRNLIKFAQGDTYSLVTIIFIGLFAFATVKGFLNDPVSLLTQNETLIAWSSAITNSQVNIYVTIALLLVALVVLIKAKFKRVFSLYDGVIVGLLVSAGWLVTGILGEESIEREVQFGSLSFVYPTGQSLELFSYYSVSDLNFGISVILGVLIGAFLMSKKNRRYSFGCTSNIKRNKLGYNMVGGAMMGVGGVVAIGCTVGQGLTGLSTLAFSSVLAISSIGISGYITAVYLHKRNKLPMCFIFEFEDEKNTTYKGPEYTI